MMKPTAEDMTRDLAADSVVASRPLPTITYPSSRALDGTLAGYALAACEGWPAAIRRALWAESVNADLLAVLERILPLLRHLECAPGPCAAHRDALVEAATVAVAKAKGEER
jgi:hypothetical protein